MDNGSSSGSNSDWEEDDQPTGLVIADDDQEDSSAPSNSSNNTPRTPISTQQRLDSPKREAEEEEEEADTTQRRNSLTTLPALSTLTGRPLTLTKTKTGTNGHSKAHTEDEEDADEEYSFASIEDLDNDGDIEEDEFGSIKRSAGPGPGSRPGPILTITPPASSTPAASIPHQLPRQHTQHYHSYQSRAYPHHRSVIRDVDDDDDEADDAEEDLESPEIVIPAMFLLELSHPELKRSMSPLQDQQSHSQNESPMRTPPSSSSSSKRSFDDVYELYRQTYCAERRSRVYYTNKKRRVSGSRPTHRNVTPQHSQHQQQTQQQPQQQHTRPHGYDQAYYDPRQHHPQHSAPYMQHQQHSYHQQQQQHTSSDGEEDYYYAQREGSYPYYNHYPQSYHHHEQQQQYQHQQHYPSGNLTHYTQQYQRQQRIEAPHSRASGLVWEEDSEIDYAAPEFVHGVAAAYANRGTSYELHPGHVTSGYRSPASGCTTSSTGSGGSVSTGLLAPTSSPSSSSSPSPDRSLSSSRWESVSMMAAASSSHRRRSESYTTGSDDSLSDGEASAPIPLAWRASMYSNSNNNVDPTKSSGSSTSVAPTVVAPRPTDVSVGGVVVTTHKKRKSVSRQRATPDQVDYLERVYARGQFPSPRDLEMAAEDLGMNIKKVRNWFQNKRAKERRTKPEPGFP
eukprot:TRINITY_DN6366_c1_g1_i1.p1 TRINITY_DN6366_c1_g1~~TRINITY_DN6366_c1_g1_i1.p1  ORF type:complete len:678 (+),score=158.88 TRINITY_DN6366_c1_g1_i1:188-2221(+)